MIATARPYGLWRDVAMRRLPGSAAFRDTLALLSFQMPIYGAIIVLGGASTVELLRGLAGVTVILLFCGRPYGLWLGFVRRRFGLPPDALMAMSRNP